MSVGSPTFPFDRVTGESASQQAVADAAEFLAAIPQTKLLWGSEDAPGMEQLLADKKQYTPEQTPSIYFALAYSQGMVVEQILRKAIGSGDLTREGILAAKQNLGEVDLGGITPTVTYTPEGGPPSRATLITEIDPSSPGFLKVVEPAHSSQVGDEIDISA